MISRAAAVALAVAVAGSAVVLYFLLRPSGTPTQPLLPPGGTPSLPLVPAPPALPPALRMCVRIKSYEDTPVGFTCDASTLGDDCTVQCCPAAAARR
jgi:hypothetical protein